MLIPKRPAVGDPIWYAKKQVGCQITRVFDDNGGRVEFAGGPIIKNARGRQLPRYTVWTRGGGLTWNVHLGMWIFGSGPRPRRHGELVLLPKPVLITGVGQGSFATIGR